MTNLQDVSGSGLMDTGVGRLAHKQPGDESDPSSSIGPPGLFHRPHTCDVFGQL